jgi:hypothetical protein
MPLAALEKFGQDNDIRSPSDLKQCAAIDALLPGIQEKDFH